MDIAVVVPCKNAERWIARCLQSVADQTVRPKMVVVVDDSSSDDSVRVISEHSLAVKLVRTDNANGAGARNAGVAHANADWIAFLDADDYWLPDHLERAISVLAKGSDVAYMAHRKLVNVSGEISEVLSPYPGLGAGGGLTPGQFIQVFAKGRAFHMSATVVDRRRLLEVGGLDERQIRRHDIDAWLRIIAGRTWAFQPIPTSVYQIDTPNSISSAKASAEYWFVRALLKNEKEYEGTGMGKLIKSASRSCLSAAFVFGDQADRERARDLVWDRLSPASKSIFTLFAGSPRTYARLNRLRNRLRSRSFERKFKPENA